MYEDVAAVEETILLQYFYSVFGCSLDYLIHDVLKYHGHFRFISPCIFFHQFFLNFWRFLEFEVDTDHDDNLKEKGDHKASKKDIAILTIEQVDADYYACRNEEAYQQVRKHDKSFNNGIDL